jgi:hypothetical protein
MNTVTAMLLAATVALSTCLACAQEEATAGPMPPEVALYLERCGGCHGLQGVSAPEIVPTLRDQAGYFLCTREGREYVAQLPSIALTPVDDTLLAALVNFVAFDIGGADATHYPRFTAEEVRLLRREPLTHGALTRQRQSIVEGLIEACGAPDVLRLYVGPQSD